MRFMTHLALVVVVAAVGCTESGNNRIGNLARSANPQIAMDGAGNAIAIWEQAGNINVRYFDATTGFGAGELITNARDNYHPEIAVAADGTAIAVWLARNPDGDILVMARRYIPELGWDTERVLEREAAATLDLPVSEFPDPGGTPRLQRGSALDPQQPQVGIDSTGNALLVWARYGNVRAVRYSLTTGWSDVIAVTNSTPLTDVLPRIATHGDGDAMVVYARYGDPENIVIDGPTESYPAQPPLDVIDVCASPFSSALESFLAPVMLDPGTKFGEYADPDVAVDASGMFMMVWTRGGQSGGIPKMASDLRFRCYRFGIGFVNDAAEVIEDILADQFQPRIAMDADGNAMVVYDSNRFSYESVMYDAELGRWLIAQSPTSPGTNGTPSRLGRVALAPNGTGYVIFGGAQDEALVHGNIKEPAARRLVGPAPLDNTFDSAANPRGDVVADASGIAIAVWQRNDAIQAHVWRRPTAAFTFTPSAPTAGALIQFNASSSTAPSTMGQIVSYDWEFPDGAAAGNGPARALGAGAHQVTLTVTDNYGQTATTTQTVTVTPASGGADRFRLTIIFEGGGQGQVLALGGELRCSSLDSGECSFIFPAGEIVWTAEALSESFFSHWTGCDSSDGPQCAVNLTADRTIRVFFE